MRHHFFLVLASRAGFRRALPAVVCAGLLAGCQLPDAGPFVDATGQLKGAVASCGAAVEGELRLVPGAEAGAAKLKAHWEARNRMMAAMLAYAESLDAIVAAGRSGAESARKVADALGGMAAAAGVAMPGSPAAVAVAADAAKLLSAQIANVRATRHLARALKEAQPAVETLTGLMRKDLGDLDRIVQEASQMVETSVAAEMSESGLQDQRKLLREAMKRTRDFSKKEDRDEFLQLSQLMAGVDTRYAAYQAKLAACAARLRAARELIHAADAALDAWTAGHAQLAVAARNRTTVNTRALVEAAVELRDLIRRIRDL